MDLSDMQRATGTNSQLLLPPVGSLSVVVFRTPVPHPFGPEPTGYVMHNLSATLDKATRPNAIVAAAHSADDRRAALQHFRPIARSMITTQDGANIDRIDLLSSAGSYPSCCVQPGTPEHRSRTPVLAIAAHQPVGAARGHEWSRRPGDRSGKDQPAATLKTWLRLVHGSNNTGASND